MISKPILLILAVLVACTVAQTAYKNRYMRFLAFGVDKKYVDQMRDLETIYEKEKAEAKNDIEKYEKAVEKLQKGYEEMEAKMPQDQLDKYLQIRYH